MHTSIPYFLGFKEKIMLVHLKGDLIMYLINVADRFYIQPLVGNHSVHSGGCIGAVYAASGKHECSQALKSSLAFSFYRKAWVHEFTAYMGRDFPIGRNY